ncbi:MAG: flavin-containing monooxygenase [Nocardioides sp.]
MDERFDVVIVGAGLSGIGAAARLGMDHPGARFVILEMRDAVGGTWDLFRYPGVRSDSDMLTLGYRFRPWRRGEALARGGDILDYVRQTAREYGVQRHIRFGHRVVRADWDSATCTWTLTCRVADEEVRVRAGFLWSCAGYYDYRGGYRPAFAGEDAFEGRIVHPQDWPGDLDYAGRRVAVIGSGATAVTLVPAMARSAGHVTMVQRSPSYVVSHPDRDGFATLARRLLPERPAYAITRWKNILAGAGFFALSRRFPRLVRRLLQARVARELPDDAGAMSHFTPSYDPWDQRICLVPRGDLFAALRAGTAAVVTGEIARFTAEGIEMADGSLLEVDLIVTATGLRLLPVGGIDLVVDGREIDLPGTMTYRATMLAGVPNFAFTIGYVNASWTLKADLVADFVCRLLDHLTQAGYRSVTPVPDPTQGVEPLVPFSSGYVVRARHLLPKQGTGEPWRLGKSYLHDVRIFRRSDLEDGVLRFR